MILLCARVASRRAGEALRALALCLLAIPLFCLPRYCHDAANRSTIGDNPDSIQAGRH
jgi:hypothetical protein